MFKRFKEIFYVQMNMPTLIKNSLMIKSCSIPKLLLIFLAVLLLPQSCKKEDDSYLVNTEVLLPANAFKTKLKTDQQYAAILHANLFQQALSANELYDIAQCI